MKPSPEDCRKARAKRKRIEREAKRKERVDKAKARDKAEAKARQEALDKIYGFPISRFWQKVKSQIGHP